MGGIVSQTGRKVSSAMNAVEKQKSTSNYYRSLIQEANKQAQAIREEYAEEEKNLLRSAAQERREAYQKYQDQLSRQKTQWASRGLTAQSATVQQWLQNNQLQQLLNEEKAAAELTGALDQQKQEATEKIRQLQEQSAGYARTYRKARSGWKLGSQLLSFFTQG